MEPAGGGQRPAFIKKRDVAIVAALLCLGLLALLLWRGGQPGAVAVVTITRGEATETMKIPLARDGVTPIEAALPVQLEVKDGAIRFIHSQCPDHLCENMGWLDAEGEWALCAPAGVLVRVEERSTS